VTVRLTSINVNGLRAAAPKGLRTWLDREQPDLVSLQEVRAPDDLVAGLLGDGWHVVHHECAAKGRAGVAVASRTPITSSGTDIGDPTADTSGRWIEATVDTADGRGLTIASAYVHTGDAKDPVRMAQKLAFLRAAVDRVATIATGGVHVVLTGDLNIAHHEIDIKNWKGNVGKAGFLPEERAELDRLIDGHGFVDLGRRFGGDGPGPYTWWTYRGQAFDNDAGWRIDYQLASPDLAAQATEVVVDRSMAYAERWSDHAPVTATYDL